MSDMLPVPYDMAIFPPNTYNETTAVVPPGTQPTANTQHLVATASATLMTTLAAASTNSPLRMFTYNLHARNAWQNEEYVRLLNLFLSLLEMRATQRQMDARYILKDEAKMLAALCSSELLYTYPHLKTLVSSDIVRDCGNNVALFNNLKKELSDMNPYQPQAVMHPGYMPVAGQQYPGTMMAPAVHPGMPHPGMIPSHAHMPYPMPAMMPHPGHGYPTAPNHHHNALAAGVRITGGVQAQGSAGSRWGGAEEEPVAHAPVAMPASQYHPVETAELSDFTVPVPGEQPVPVPELSPYLAIIGGNEMERARHQIPFFAGINSARGGDRYRDLAETVKVRFVNRVMESGEAIPPETWLLTDSIDLAFQDSLEFLINRTDDETHRGAFRGFYKTPVKAHDLLSSALEPSLDSIRSATSLTECASRIRIIAGISQEETGELDDMVSDFILGLERELTKSVNSFLANSLSLSTTIDSFAADIADLEPYLAKQIGSDAVRAFKRFETETLFRLSEKVDLGQLDPEDEVPYIAFFRSVSITAIRMNNYELGYLIEPGQTKIINQETAPTLYQIAKTLFDFKIKHKRHTEDDYVVTTDGVRYKLYEDYQTDGVYRIALD